MLRRTKRFFYSVTRTFYYRKLSRISCYAHCLSDVSGGYNDIRVVVFETQFAISSVDFAESPMTRYARICTRVTTDRSAPISCVKMSKYKISRIHATFTRRTLSEVILLTFRQLINSPRERFTISHRLTEERTFHLYVSSFPLDRAKNVLTGRLLIFVV